MAERTQCYTVKYKNSDNIWVVNSDTNRNLPDCLELPEHGPSLLNTLNAGLSPSALSLPVKTVPTAGAAVTSGTLAGGHIVYKVC
jgi:hypothetical protein